MTELRNLQATFGRALRAADAPLPQTDGAPDFTERFGAYRNNAWQFFLTALELTYPVLRRRVGDEYFRELVRDYRTAHPSTRGDLHWAGESFPAWLEWRLEGSGYEWLADLARLEWAVAAASVAAQQPALELTALGTIEPDALADLQLAWQPSLRFVASPYPVWTVWQANQDDDTTSPVDLALGGECCVTACVADRPAVYRLAPADYELLQRLASGDTLGAAMATTATDASALGRVLAWAFAEGLVVGLVSPSARA